MDCKYCHYPQTIKRWWYGKDWQRYKCKSCNRTFTIWSTKRKYYSFIEKQHVVNISKWYSNLARVCRIYKISKNTVYNRRKEVDKYNIILQTKMWYY
jgi:transposase-like protein